MYKFKATIDTKKEKELEKMSHLLQDFLFSRGYQRASKQGALFIKEENECVYLIQITRADYNRYSTKEEYVRNRQQLIFYWNGKTRKPVELLNLIVVSSTQIPEIMKVAQEIEDVWLIDETKKRLVLFENQTNRFDNLYRPLENWLQEETNQESYSPKQCIGTSILIILNVIIFLLISRKGDVYSSSFMFEMGAQNWYSVFYEHEYYRILTSMFLHFGWNHLFNNMLVLGIAGNQLEKKVGTIRFCILYFMAGIVGNIVSNIGYALQGIHAVCAGASGAIYGVLGAILIQLCFDKEQRRQFSPIRIIVLLFMSFYLSVTEGSVDYFAHTGGFVMGMILGAIFYLKNNRFQKTGSK